MAVEPHWISDEDGARRFHVAVPVRWRDLDAYNHVNNATMFTLLEEARIAAFWRMNADDPTPKRPLAVVDATADADTHTLIRSHEIEFRAPIPFGIPPLDIAVWISELGTASVEVSYEVRSADRADLFVVARSGLVFVDAHTNRPRRVIAEERAAWEPFTGPRIPMRIDRRA